MDKKNTRACLRHKLLTVLVGLLASSAPLLAETKPEVHPESCEIQTASCSDHPFFTNQEVLCSGSVPAVFLIVRRDVSSFSSFRVQIEGSDKRLDANARPHSTAEVLPGCRVEAPFMVLEVQIPKGTGFGTKNFLLGLDLHPNDRRRSIEPKPASVDLQPIIVDRLNYSSTSLVPVSSTDGALRAMMTLDRMPLWSLFDRRFEWTFDFARDIKIKTIDGQPAARQVGRGYHLKLSRHWHNETLHKLTLITAELQQPIELSVEVEAPPGWLYLLLSAVAILLARLGWTRLPVFVELAKSLAKLSKIRLVNISEIIKLILLRVENLNILSPRITVNYNDYLKKIPLNHPFEQVYSARGTVDLERGGMLDWRHGHEGRVTIPADTDTKLDLVLRLSAGQPSQEKRLFRGNLAFMLDCSGTMNLVTDQPRDETQSTAELPPMQIAREAMHQVITQLNHDVVFTFGTFGSEVKSLCEPQLLTSEVKREIQSKLGSLDFFGPTDLMPAIEFGAKTLRIWQKQASESRLLILSDGGTDSDKNRILKRAQEILDEGFSIDTFGFGGDDRAAFLEDLSSAGNGSFFSIERPVDLLLALRKFLLQPDPSRKFEVALHFQPSNRVRDFRLEGFDRRIKGNGATASSVVADGEQQALVLRIEPKRLTPGQRINLGQLVVRILPGASAGEPVEQLWPIVVDVSRDDIRATPEARENLVEVLQLRSRDAYQRQLELLRVGEWRAALKGLVDLRDDLRTLKKETRDRFRRQDLETQANRLQLQIDELSRRAQKAATREDWQLLVHRWWNEMATLFGA